MLVLVLVPVFAFVLVLVPVLKFVLVLVLVLVFVIGIHSDCHGLCEI